MVDPGCLPTPSHSGGGEVLVEPLERGEAKATSQLRVGLTGLLLKSLYLTQHPPRGNL